MGIVLDGVYKDQGEAFEVHKIIERLEQEYVSIVVSYCCDVPKGKKGVVCHMRLWLVCVYLVPCNS